MLVAKGHGEGDPIASNDTAGGWLKNRRIESHALKAPTRRPNTDRLAKKHCAKLTAARGPS